MITEIKTQTETLNNKPSYTIFRCGIPVVC